MIENNVIAEHINELMINCAGRLNSSIRLVMDNCPEEKCKRLIDRVHRLADHQSGRRRATALDRPFYDAPNQRRLQGDTGGASLLIAAAVYLLLELGLALGKIGRMLRNREVPDDLTRKNNSQDAIARTALGLSGFGSLIVQIYAAIKVVALNLGLSSFVAGVFLFWGQVAPYLGICIAASISIGVTRLIRAR